MKELNFSKYDINDKTKTKEKKPHLSFYKNVSFTKKIKQ